MSSCPPISMFQWSMSHSLLTTPLKNGSSVTFSRNWPGASSWATSRSAMLTGAGFQQKKQLIIVYIYIYTYVSTYILYVYMLYHKRVSWDHVEKQYLNESELNPLINSNSLLIAFEGWRKTHRKSIWMPNQTHERSNAVAGARPATGGGKSTNSTAVVSLQKSPTSTRFIPCDISFYLAQCLVLLLVHPWPIGA